MSQNVSQYLLNRVHDEWGVKRIYGYPGDGINGLIGAFHQVGEKIAFTQMRHEEIAAFAACAHAKFTGEVGVCMATSGPGAIHLLNGLYDAKLDHQPVVAIVGQQKRMSLGGNFQQEVDLQVLFKDVCAEFVQYVMTPEQTQLVVDRAFRVALATRSPTCIIVPADVQESEYEEPPRMHGALFTSAGVTRPHVTPTEADLQKAAEILNAGKKVAILIGQGAKNASAEVKEVADLLGSGVAKALNGKDALPDDLPFVTGGIGLLGTKPSNEMMEQCDTLLMIGTGFPYAEWLPKPGQARGLQIDIDGRLLGNRYPTELNLIGDSRDTLRALIPHLHRKQDRSFREMIEGEVARWWEILGERAMDKPSGEGMCNPLRVFHELDKQLPAGVLTSSDSGSATNWWARHVKAREGSQFALSGTLATMCPGLPYAIAAKLAYPERPVVGVMGDGAFQMLGVNTLIDVAKYRHEWAGRNETFVVLVLNNHDLNQVTWEQRVLAGDPKVEVSQVLPDFPYAQYAESLGFKGIRVTSDDELEAAWKEAFASDRPVLLEAVTDPEYPPLPPHIRFEQAQKLMMALAKGDENRGRIIKESIRGKLHEFTTRS
ncbi:MAG TPA: thiamine pyrophosphate-requiring protein [Solirubrobacteraceae bacterium]|nr:thiamine pyrophosphate-requiring protein [Solirubrobacteraceae bacterium]